MASFVCVTAAVVAGAQVAPSVAAASAAHTYYVSATGNDGQDGMSPATAWSSLKPLNARDLAGDTVLLEGGSTFVGPLNLDAQDSGVTVGSFGSGRGRILGEGSPGVLAYNASGITVRNLDLSGDASAFATKGGLSIFSDRPAGQRLSRVTISHVTVRGFKNGVEIGGANPGAGFAHVSIADVKAIGNRDAGVITYGPAFNRASPTYANTDVNVIRTTANKNLGNAADKLHNSGNGIVLGSVDGGSITRSVARGNGLLCAAGEGPAGIWTYDSRAVRIAYNTATGNRTAGSADGDGFDLDQNVSDSFLEHNTSSGNDGAGYLVYAGPETANDHNVVRSNLSKSDARRNSWYGGITLAGEVHSVTVTANTVDTRTSASHAPALAIKRGVTKARIADNDLRSAAGYDVVKRS